MKKIAFLLYILISTMLILLAFMNNEFVGSKILVSAILFFFMVALTDHYRDIKN